MTQDRPHQTPSNADFNITAIIIVCLVGLLLVWSTGVSVSQLWHDMMRSGGPAATTVLNQGADASLF